MGKRNLRECLSARVIPVMLSFAKVSIKGEGDDADASLYGFPLPRRMTVRVAGNDARLCPTL